MLDLKIDKLIRTNRKSFSIVINSDAKLIIRAPLDASEETINKILNKKRRWIIKNQKLAQERYSKIPKKEIKNGEGFYYLGKIYTLQIINNKNEDYEDIYIDGKYLYINKNQVNEGINKIIEWYKNEAIKIIESRVKKYSKISGLEYNKVRITNANKHWGSCTSYNNLNFSWKLIMATLEVIDYVVVHELCHIEEKNHSKDFWNKIKVIMPNYENHKNWLKNYGYILTI